MLIQNQALMQIENLNFIPKHIQLLVFLYLRHKSNHLQNSYLFKF